MIVQTAPEGAPRFVMRMSEHTVLSDPFVEAFGNADFEPLEDEVSRYIIANHYADVGRPLRSVAVAVLPREPAGVVRGSVCATGGVWDENGTRSVYTAHRKAGCDAFGCR